MLHVCYICATCMLNKCYIYAKYMLHVCYIYATCMLHDSAFHSLSPVMSLKNLLKKHILRFVSLYRPLNDFCIYMPDDGTTKFRNMYNTQGGPKVCIQYILCYIRDRGSTVVKVLRYKSEGLWFDSRWRHWNFSLT